MQLCQDRHRCLLLTTGRSCISIVGQDDPRTYQLGRLRGIRDLSYTTAPIPSWSSIFVTNGMQGLAIFK
jgi:hypothetical protein